MPKLKVIESFGFFEPGPDPDTSGPFREFSAGQVIAEATDEQATAWIDKGHVEPAGAAAPAEPASAEPGHPGP